MPLSAPAGRKLLHLRDIELRGYEREDGLVDIEAHLTDTKSYGYDADERGWIAPGEPLHDMWVRMTVDVDLTIIACEAVSDRTPYAICPSAAPNFSRLAGVKIGHGFHRAVNERVGGITGCTHLREVLAQMATVAYQTLYPIRRRRELAAAAVGGGATVAANPKRTKPALVGTCLAYAPDSSVVQRRWPWYHPEKQTEPAGD